MEKQLQITFHELAHDDAVEERIRAKARKLEEIHDRIVGLRVVVEAPHRHQKKGRLFNVRIDLTLPTGEIIVNRESGDQQSHEDVFVAIRDAFDAARRQLQTHVERLRA